MNGRDEFARDLDDIRWGFGMILLKLGLPLLILVLVLGGLGWVFGIFGQGAKIIEKTTDADNVIGNYEWFKQCYEDLQATDVKIKNAEAQIKSFEESAGPRKDWTFEDKTEHSRLNSVLLGLKNYREELVAKYNARSKMANRKIFKSGDLPESVK
jgi:hypothetical protein